MTTLLRRAPGGLSVLILSVVFCSNAFSVSLVRRGNLSSATKPEGVYEYPSGKSAYFNWNYKAKVDNVAFFRFLDLSQDTISVEELGRLSLPLNSATRAQTVRFQGKDLVVFLSKWWRVESGEEPYVTYWLYQLVDITDVKNPRVLFSFSNSRRDKVFTWSSANTFEVRTIKDRLYAFTYDFGFSIFGAPPNALLQITDITDERSQSSQAWENFHCAVGERLASVYSLELVQREGRPKIQLVIQRGHGAEGVPIACDFDLFDPLRPKLDRVFSYENVGKTERWKTVAEFGSLYPPFFVLRDGRKDSVFNLVGTKGMGTRKRWADLFIWASPLSKVSLVPIPEGTNIEAVFRGGKNLVISNALDTPRDEITYHSYELSQKDSLQKKASVFSLRENHVVPPFVSAKPLLLTWSVNLELTQGKLGLIDFSDSEKPQRFSLEVSESSMVWSEKTLWLKDARNNRGVVTFGLRASADGPPGYPVFQLIE